MNLELYADGGELTRAFCYLFGGMDETEDYVFVLGSVKVAAEEVSGAPEHLLKGFFF